MSNNDNTMVTNSQSSEMSANEIFNDDTSTKMRNLWDLLNSLDWDKKYQVSLIKQHLNNLPISTLFSSLHLFICFSTWSVPSWCPVQSMSSLLISIQSLLSPNPYHDEPDFEQERRSDDSKTYNEIIQRETLRVVVCEMLENSNSCLQ
ncbi:unnamed protein product [Rotaria sordida]|uniref:Uncharacterized protein n=1 Tax=Rotaria sordida TaxID=392033 RepID=A0A819EAA8_9BILA|nr:unnamed protein product [Rotaria sordida]CAF4001012.1 unnamed protein product [Rotaria sordida]